MPLTHPTEFDCSSGRRASYYRSQQLKILTGLGCLHMLSSHEIYRRRISPGYFDNNRAYGRRHAVPNVWDRQVGSLRFSGLLGSSGRLSEYSGNRTWNPRRNDDMQPLRQHCFGKYPLVRIGGLAYKKPGDGRDARGSEGLNVLNYGPRSTAKPTSHPPGISRGSRNNRHSASTCNHV